MVVKCEAHAQGTNRRAVVTNRPGAFVLPGAAYAAYADRGESQPGTWRTRLIKVAARVRQTTRRVIVELSSSWPDLEHFRKIGQRLTELGQPAADSG